LFGRPPRDTGLESERNNNFTAGQRLHLLNSAHIQRKIDQGPGLTELTRSGKSLENIIDDLYLTILSRHPTPDEVSGAVQFARGARPGLEIAWALINNPEFLCRH